MPTPNTLTDQQLADLFKTGDAAAFTAIYQRYWQRIYVIAVKRLGDPHDAEEVVQEVFLNFWRRRFSFTLTTGFRNYFAVAVKFEIMDLMRKRAHATAYQQDAGLSLSEADYTTLRELDLMELQQQLALSVNALPEKCRIVFRLRHEDGYTQKEIAAELDISEKMVEAHLSNARKKLRGSFGGLFSALLFLYF